MNTTIILDKFPNYVISYDKSISEHTQKIISIENINTKDVTRMLYDDRYFNYLIIYDNSSDTECKKITEYIYTNYLEIKNSDIKYGSYEKFSSVNSKGICRLYLYQIFDYIMNKQRYNKLINLIIDDD